MNWKKVNELMEIENDVEIILVPIDAFKDLELNMEDIEGLMRMVQPFRFTGPPILQEKDG